MWRTPSRSEQLADLPKALAKTVVSLAGEEPEFRMVKGVIARNSGGGFMFVSTDPKSGLTFEIEKMSQVKIWEKEGVR